MTTIETMVMARHTALLEEVGQYIYRCVPEEGGGGLTTAHQLSF